MSTAMKKVRMIMARTKQVASTPKCPICGGDMPIEYIANFEQLTGRAEWHLPFAPRIKMCAKCDYELIKAVTKWFSKVNVTDEYKKAWCQYDK